MTRMKKKLNLFKQEHSHKTNRQIFKECFKHEMDICFKKKKN